MVQGHLLRTLCALQASLWDLLPSLEELQCPHVTEREGGRHMGYFQTVSSLTLPTPKQACLPPDKGGRQDAPSPRSLPTGPHPGCDWCHGSPRG